MFRPSVSEAIASILLVAAMATLPGPAHADAVTDANARAAEVVTAIRETPVAARALAIAQVSVFDAVQSIRGTYRPWFATFTADKDASVDAAVAAATRSALLAVLPAEKTKIEADYQAALATVPEGASKAAGIEAGEKAAAAVLAARANDGADAPNTYRPRTAPGVYVPTTLPLLPQWGGRKPWLMATGRQLRPAPPPKLDSRIWKRDLAESAELGAKNSTRRTAEQTAMARFWEVTAPAVYWNVARSVATAREADASENARFMAAAAVAMDDAFIAVLDAKYAYEFWRPITAIRNAPPGVRDPAWEPMITTPMHPEYPCAHCIVAASLGAVIEAEIGDGPSPRLRTTAGGVERSWPTPAEFVKEVSEARICAGVHYRNSTEVGRAMGKKIGELAVARFPKQVAAKK